jgi:hypothetical protein
MKQLLFFLTVASLVSPGAFAQNKLDLQGGDTVRSVLEHQVGKAIELRMKSGEKMGGKLEKVTDKLILLSHLTDADFYDAAIEIDSISGVVVRARSN